MKWWVLGLGSTAAAAALAWALVTTGHWPLDDRVQPAAAIYALNGALGYWLLEHGGDVPAGPPGAPAREGLTAAELLAARETLRTDPRFRGRHRYTPVPVSAPSGRG